MTQTPTSKTTGESQAPGPAPGFGVGVLYVGTSPQHRHQVASAISRLRPHDKLHHVPDYLHAIGHLHQTDPPKVIIMSLDDLPTDDVQELADAVQVLRSLVGDALMLVHADPEHAAAARAAVDTGFDDYLLEPINSADLARAGMHHGEATPLTTPTPEPDQSTDPNVHATEPALTQLVEQQLDHDLPAEPAAAPSPVQASQKLGDVDLLEQLLSGRRSLRELALRLVEQHSRLAGLELLEAHQTPSRELVSVEVTWSDQLLGQLCAKPPITAAQLEPWAAWLSRWLAMEQRMADLWELALHDDMTGLWNRRYFDRFLNMILKRAARERFRVTLLVFDIDDFKVYNDGYGHAAGDEILIETARLLSSVVRDHDVVARIGGDEFAVIFWDFDGPRRPNSEHPNSPVQAAKRFQRAICDHKFPKLANEAPGSLTISGGLAGFPWDGQTPQALLEHADLMAIESKRLGKNAIKIGQGAAQNCDLPVEDPT